MKIFASILMLMGALSMVGCASIARHAGATCEVKGIVRDRSDRTPVSNLSVKISGAGVGWIFVGIPLPMVNYEPLREVTTDGQGRFSCMVPLYSGYRISVGDMARTKWGRGDIAAGVEADIFVGPPLSAKKEPN